MFVLNPQFEWCGGGHASTPLDLARRARILFSGAGALLGHDGVFPGYRSTMGWFPEHRVAAALQVNHDGGAGGPMHGLLVRFATITTQER